jgi:hypothetical protein
LSRDLAARPRSRLSRRVGPAAPAATARPTSAKVRITGIGILQVKKREARMGRNPATGEAIKIKASKKVVLRVAKDLKEAI